MRSAKLTLWGGRVHGAATVNSLDFAVRSHSMSPIEVEGTRELAYARGTYQSVLSVRMDGEEVTIPDEGSWLAVVRRDEDGAWRFYRLIYNTDLAAASDTDQ